jgi:hypothetical protein
MVNIHTGIETLREDGPGAGSEIEDRGHVFALMSGIQKNGLEITPETSIPQWHGEPMDYGEAVDVLLGFE